MSLVHYNSAGTMFIAVGLHWPAGMDFEPAPNLAFDHSWTTATEEELLAAGVAIADIQPDPPQANHM